MKRAREAGLTQLEVMVSLAIMGMITVFLASALNFNRQTIERFEALSGAADEMLARRRLRKWIEQIPLSGNLEKEAVQFEGSKGDLIFQSLVEDGIFWGGSLVKFSINVRPLGKTKILAVRGSGRHPTNNELIEFDWIIARSVENVTFSYFGKSSVATDKTWHSSWSQNDRLPELVKVEWDTKFGAPAPPLTLLPGKKDRQRFMSLSSLVPPG